MQKDRQTDRHRYVHTFIHTYRQTWIYTYIYMHTYIRLRFSPVFLYITYNKIKPFFRTTPPCEKTR